MNKTGEPVYQSISLTDPLGLDGLSITDGVPRVSIDPVTGKKDIYWTVLPSKGALTYSGNDTWDDRSQLLIWSGNSDKVVTTGWDVGPQDVPSTNTGYALYINADVVHASTTGNNKILEVSETTIGEIPIIMFTIGIVPAGLAGGLGTEAWYYASDAGILSGGTTQPTFTADTNTSVTLTNVSSFTGLYIGQTLSGTNIPADTYITALNSGASTITMSNAATGSTVGVTVSRSPAAKITSTNFPTNQAPALSLAGPLVPLNGKIFAMATNGQIYNSYLENIVIWGAIDFISTNDYPDAGVSLSKIKNHLVAFNANSTEFFSFVGTPDGEGSALQKRQEMTIKIGCLRRRHLRGNSVISVDHQLAWLGTTTSGGSGEVAIYLMTSPTEIEKINTPPILADIIQGGSFSDSTANGVFLLGSAQFLGESIISFAYNSVGTTTPLFYFRGTKIWAYSSYTREISGVKGNVYSISGNDVYLASGLTKQWSNSMVFVTGHMDHGTFLDKNFHACYVVCRHAAAWSGSANLSYTSNSYQSVSGSSQAMVGMPDPDASTGLGILSVNILGTARRRQWTVTVSGSAEFSIHSINFVFTVADY